MRYLSGIHGLNIDCKLNTTGDWHQSAIQWDDLHLLDSNESVFKEYGIEKNKKLTFLKGEPKYNVANHIRSCLDLLEQGNFATIQNMRNGFICTDEYDEEIFQKVLLLTKNPKWREINQFMEKEYKMKWLRFIKKQTKGGECYG